MTIAQVEAALQLAPVRWLAVEGSVAGGFVRDRLPLDSVPFAAAPQEPGPPISVVHARSRVFGSLVIRPLGGELGPRALPLRVFGLVGLGQVRTEVSHWWYEAEPALESQGHLAWRWGLGAEAGLAGPVGLRLQATETRWTEAWDAFTELPIRMWDVSAMVRLRLT